MKFFTFLIIIFLPLQSTANFFYDNEEKVLLDSLWVDVKELFSSYQLEEAEALAFQLLEKSEDLAYDEGISNAHWGLAMIYKRQGNIGEAAKYLFSSINISIEGDDMSRAASGYYNLGQIFHDSEDDENALLYFEEALKLYRLKGDKRLIANAYYEMARSEIDLKNYETARNQLKNALAHLDQLEDPEEKKESNSLVSKIYNILGISYLENAESEQAVKNFELSIQYAAHLKDSTRKKAIGYNNIGEAYLKAKDFSNAEKYLNEALSLKRELGEMPMAVSTLTKLGQLYSQKGQPEKALGYLRLAIENADKAEINEKLQEAISEIVSLNEMNQGALIDATEVLAYMKIQNDQLLLTKETNNDLHFLKNRYLLENAYTSYALTEDNNVLHAQLSKSKIMLGIIFLLFLATCWLSYIYIRRYKLLNALKNETELGLELISQQLDRTIRAASKKQ